MKSPSDEEIHRAYYAHETQWRSEVGYLDEHVCRNAMRATADELGLEYEHVARVLADRWAMRGS